MKEAAVALPFVRRLLWGVRVGVLLAWTLAAITCVAFLLKGPDESSRLSLTVWKIVLVFTAAGIVGGALVGAALSVIRYRVVAATIGVFVALAFGFGIQYAGSDPATWESATYFGTALYALCIGVPVGLIYREIFWVGGGQPPR